MVKNILGPKVTIDWVRWLKNFFNAENFVGIGSVVKKNSWVQTIDGVRWLKNFFNAENFVGEGSVDKTILWPKPSMGFGGWPKPSMGFGGKRIFSSVIFQIKRELNVDDYEM